jgi:endo-1,4-beta-mannosidase
MISIKVLLKAVVLILSVSVVTSQTDGYVRVDPSDRRYFQLNGKRFQFQGANQRELAISLTSDQIAKKMKDNSDMGIKVVRLWAFNEESCGVTGCFAWINENKQPVINDYALRRLDYVLYYARQYNIKVILAPVNYERSFGGMEWWVHTLKGKRQLFFCCSV